VIIVVTFGLIDGGLRLIDPLGVMRNIDDVLIQFTNMQPDAVRGYAAKPGQYKAARWSFAIDELGNRVMPNVINPRCRVALAGDSVTFGMGINDNETWGARLAAQYPDVQFTNWAHSGYNIDQIESIINSVSADGYLYLAIGNDAEEPFDWRNPPRTTDHWAITIYVYWMRYIIQWRPIPIVEPVDDMPARYRTAMARLIDNPRVQIAAFASDGLAQAAAHRWPGHITILPLYRGVLSVADSHPNVEGHAQIAEQIAPLVPALCKLR
jgi:hypothetical protein